MSDPVDRVIFLLTSLLACACLVMRETPVAVADSLPEWAASRVSAAPPAPGEETEQSYRTLYTETHMGISSEGTRVTRQRTILQIIKATNRIHVGGFSLQGDAKMRVTRAWSVYPGQKAEPIKLPPIDVTSQQTFLSDARARLIEVAGVQHGSLVVFEFEAVETLTVLGWAVDFGDNVEVLESRFELQTPPGWNVKAAWLRCVPPPMFEDDNIRSWKLRNLHVPEPDEPFGERAIDRSPILNLNLEPPSGTPSASLAIPEWPSLASWYERLARGRDAVTPVIQSAAKRALETRAAAAKGSVDSPAAADGAPGAPGFFEKVRAEAGFVRDSVRYLDVEIGIGSFQPRPAADTLANLYGDCKDKATLLTALLAAEGITAWPVLVNATERDTVDPSVPAANAFNHVVSAIPIPQGSAPPAWAAHAVVDAGEIGRILVVDTTDEENAIGAIPIAIAGKHALVVAAPHGRLVTLPAADPTAHGVDRAFTVDVHPDRSLDVAQVVRFTGFPASILRILRKSSEKDMRLSADKRISDVWVDARFKGVTLENESSDGTFVARMAWTIPPLPARGPESEIVLFPGAGNELPHVPLAQRTSAVDLGFPQTVRFETTIEGLPANAELPDRRALKGDAWTLRTDYVRNGTALVATWEMQLTKSRFDPEAFSDLKRLYVAIRATTNEAVQLAP